MMLADEWYSSATLWAALAVPAGLLAGLVGAWATLQSANPKRRLDYWVSKPLPLLNTNGAGLEVRRNGRALTDPHVLEIQLLNRGRRDITSSYFDAGQPIRLDVGVPIIELLTTTSEPTSLHLPTAVIDGTALNIGPSLLARRQMVTFAVLVEGHSTQPGLQAALQDVSVKASWDPARRQASTITGGTILGSLGTSWVALLGPAIFAVGSSDALGTAVAVLLAGLWTGAGSWWAATTWARRR